MKGRKGSTTRKAHRRRLKSGMVVDVRKHFLCYWKGLSSVQKKNNVKLLNTFTSWNSLRGSEKNKWGKILLKETPACKTKNNKKKFVKSKKTAIKQSIHKIKSIHHDRLRRKYAPSTIKYGIGNYPTLKRDTGLTGVEENNLIKVAEKYGNGDKIDLNALIDSSLSYNENKQIIIKNLKPSFHDVRGIL